jgi:hypothetical protein
MCVARMEVLEVCLVLLPAGPYHRVRGRFQNFEGGGGLDAFLTGPRSVQPDEPADLGKDARTLETGEVEARGH